MLVHPSGVDVPGSALRFLAARLRERRRALGIPWRRLGAGRTALLTLAPTFAEAVRAASMKAFVILDGTLLPIDRIAADRTFYSGVGTAELGLEHPPVAHGVVGVGRAVLVQAAAEGRCSSKRWSAPSNPPSRIRNVAAASAAIPLPTRYAFAIT